MAHHFSPPPLLVAQLLRKELFFAASLSILNAGHESEHLRDFLKGYHEHLHEKIYTKEERNIVDNTRILLDFQETWRRKNYLYFTIWQFSANIQNIKFSGLFLGKLIVFLKYFFIKWWNTFYFFLLENGKWPRSTWTWQNISFKVWSIQRSGNKNQPWFRETQIKIYIRVHHFLL